jgi:hypothetical protein
VLRTRSEGHRRFARVPHSPKPSGGVGQAAVLELAVREHAKREHVAPEKPTHQRTCTATAVD